MGREASPNDSQTSGSNCALLRGLAWGWPFGFAFRCLVEGPLGKRSCLHGMLEDVVGVLMCSLCARSACAHAVVFGSTSRPHCSSELFALLLLASCRADGGTDWNQMQCYLDVSVYLSVCLPVFPCLPLSLSNPLSPRRVTSRTCCGVSSSTHSFPFIYIYISYATLSIQARLCNVLSVFT